MRILVTGGAGFVGSHLVDLLLAQKHEVLVVDSFVTSSRRNLAHVRDHARLRIVRRDVARAPHGPFARVYHLASPASPDDYTRLPIQTLMTNSVGTRRALDIATRARARFLLCSTSEVYGEPIQHPQRESDWGNVDPVGPRSAYDEGKRFAEALTIAYVRAHDLDARIARIFNTYGPRMRPSDGRMPSAFITSVLRGDPILVHGTGRQTRSLSYVEDTARGLIAAMERGKRGTVYNIGRPDELSVMEFAHLVRSLTGGRAPIRRVPGRPSDIHRRRPDIRRAKRDLRWRPIVPLGRGLTETIRWFAQELGVERLALTHDRRQRSPER